MRWLLRLLWLYNCVSIPIYVVGDSWPVSVLNTCSTVFLWGGVRPQGAPALGPTSEQLRAAWAVLRGQPLAYRLVVTEASVTSNDPANPTVRSVDTNFWPTPVGDVVTPQPVLPNDWAEVTARMVAVSRQWEETRVSLVVKDPPEPDETD